MSDGTIEARVAARWWADRLTDRTAAKTKHERMDMFLRLAQEERDLPTPEQVEAFRAALEAEILAGPATSENWAYVVESGDITRSVGCRISVDYDPDPMLARALAAAGIRNDGPAGPLPVKTTMRVDPGRVLVSFGYWESAVKLDLGPDVFHMCEPPVDPVDGPDVWTCPVCGRVWERREETGDQGEFYETWYEPAWGPEGAPHPAASDGG